MEAEAVVTEAKQMLPGNYKHNEKVLGVRSLRQDYTSYQGFANPAEIGAEVFAPDWSNVAECGKGLHFIPWGIGHDGQEHGFDRPVWQVIEPIGEVVTLEGKCKSHGLRIVHTGTLSECMALTHAGRTAFIQSIAEKTSTGDSSSAASTGYSSSAASTGYRSSAASTGYSSSAASTGDRSSAASTGDRSSAASTGYRSSAASTGYSSSAASTGDRSSAASTGYRSSAASTGYSSSAASTGECTAAVSTGPGSKAKAGAYSCIALAAWIVVDEDTTRLEMRCAEIGIGDGSDGKLKANVWYELDEEGKFIEA